MDNDRFWAIIDASTRVPDGSQDRQEAALKQELVKLDLPEIAAFDKIFQQQLNRAYTWDLWGAAYIINGGCSDDGFEYFRRALIASGRENFENTLKNPDSLAEWAPEDMEFESFRYAVYDAYEEKGGEGLPAYELEPVTEPAGEEWSEDSDDLEKRFPALWERFGA